MGRIRLSGGSRKITELSATFSADIMVPPNFTEVLSVNFEGESFKFILEHNSASLSICLSNSCKVLANKQKSSMFFNTLKSLSNFVPPSVIQLKRSWLEHGIPVRPVLGYDGHEFA